MRFLVAVFCTAVLVAGAAAQQLPLCGSPSIRLDAFVSENQQGSFLNSVNVSCSSLLAFSMDPTLNNSTNLNINSRGDYLYASPPVQMAEMYVVTVSCFNTPQCVVNVYVSVAVRLTSPPSPSPVTPAPTPAQTECPHVYWFSVGRNTTMSDSLRNAAGQIPCGVGRTYAVTRNPNPLIGSLYLTPIGDFRYTSLVNVDTWDDFGFSMFCQGVLTCKGTAYMMISNAIATAPPVQSYAPSYTYAPGGTSAPGTPTNVIVTPMPGLTCTGTCNTDVWRAVPSNPSVWDTTPGASSPRADQKPLNGIEASWVAGGLVIKAYSRVGNVGMRFPTFEDVQVLLGEAFTGLEQRQRVSQTSVPFDLNCLDLQSTSTGLAADVWKVTSAINGSGSIGPNYASLNSWYQKFGGKHINCDTFYDACKYAPLLTPLRNQDPNTGGVWSVFINSCDVTWTGTFSFSALRAMRKADGTSVWSMADRRVLQSSIASEAVKPASWTSISAGVSANIARRNMILVLQPKVKVTLDDANAKLFSVDAEYFEYTDAASGDRAFGLNILFYPHVDASATSSYAPDRHVTGWRWASQVWQHPDPFQCPTCAGTDLSCYSADTTDVSYTSDIFFGGDCSNPVVTLFKGPPFTVADCPANQMHVMNRAGFGPPQFCRTSFQNITLRGIAVGSGPSLNMTGTFSFEGKVTLQLLLDNGAQPTIDLELGMIVGFASVEGIYNGGSDVCRAGLYWPVLDPLGTSTPDVPHPLSFQDPVELCSDRLDRTFGPQGWALMTYDISEPSGQIPYTRVQVESIFVSFPGSPNIYLLRTDATTNLATTTLPPMENAVWWYRDYPFFNFRDLSARLPNQTFPVAANVAPITGQDYAFAFTPGALGIATELTVTATFRVLPLNSSQNTNRVTYNRVLRLDPSLTALVRFGPPQLVVADTGSTGTSSSSVVAMVAAGVLVVALIIAFAIEVADANNPLLGGVVKTLKLLQMPLLLPVKIIQVGTKTVVGGNKKAPEVKRATKGGIPIATETH